MKFMRTKCWYTTSLQYLNEGMHLTVSATPKNHHDRCLIKNLSLANALMSGGCVIGFIRFTEAL